MDTIVFFGSARLKSKKDAQSDFNKIKNANPKTIPNFAKELRQAQQHLEMSRYYEDAVELSKRLTEWSMNLETMQTVLLFAICFRIWKQQQRRKKLWIFCWTISSFEQYVNPFVTKELSFEFHYFFMRKFWFAYLSKALVVFPGGFGTFDELFEILTLVQTDKIRKKLAIVIYDEKYWKSVVNFDALIENGVINESDLKLFHFCNDVDTAFNVIKDHLEKNFLKEKEPAVIEPRIHIK
jgi:predicted Rossmann-fold nucleotide-binding protein